jgi:hypothetical protein
MKYDSAGMSFLFVLIGVLIFALLMWLFNW